MRLAIGIAAALASIVPHKAEAAKKRDVCHTKRCEERVARKACSQTRPKACIRRAAIHWRVSEAMLLRKTKCESGFNPYAYYGAPFNRTPLSWDALMDRDLSAGLMQFKARTWTTTPYARRSIWRAKWNALAGAWMHSAGVGRGGEWACA